MAARYRFSRAGSHGAAFLFGLSLSVLLTFCSSSSGQGTAQDRIERLEEIVANATTTKVQYTSTINISPVENSGELTWGLNALTGATVGETVLEFQNEAAGGGRTKFVALYPCQIHITANFVPGTSLDRFAVLVNNTNLIAGDTLTSSVETSDASQSFVMNAGDFFTVGTNGTITSFKMTIVAAAEVPLEDL